jgi:CheY-like chemotaxis protein/HPt (histidine-containing phosphotransfer) domain-containing protein
MPYLILHVDDDPDIREVVSFALGIDPAFDVKSCAGGEEALDITDRGTIPDLILCDVMMPGIDGPELLRRLREKPTMAGTPVIFMTARAQTKDLEQFKVLGAKAVITKPFDPMALADAVRGHMGLGAHVADHVAADVAADVAANGTPDREAADHGFFQSMRTEAAKLKKLREELLGGPSSSGLFDNLRSCAHKLAGSAGVFGFREISDLASSLEEALLGKRAEQIIFADVAVKLDALLARIEREAPSTTSVVDLGETSCRSSHALPQIGERHGKHN